MIHKTYTNGGQAIIKSFHSQEAADAFDHASEGLTPAADYVKPTPDALVVAKAARVEHLTAECKTAITGGFPSNAINTGQAFNYDSRVEDQTNLSDAIIALGVNGGTFAIVCNDPSGQDGFIERNHTEAQAKKVKADFAAYRLGRSQHLTTKIAAVNAAADVAAVNAINW